MSAAYTQEEWESLIKQASPAGGAPSYDEDKIKYYLQNRKWSQSALEGYAQILGSAELNVRAKKKIKALNLKSTIESLDLDKNSTDKLEGLIIEEIKKPEVMAMWNGLELLQSVYGGMVLAYGSITPGTGLEVWKQMMIDHALGLLGQDPIEDWAKPEKLSGPQKNKIANALEGVELPDDDGDADSNLSAEDLGSLEYFEQ